MFKYFERNTKGRDFVIGDVHGMFNLVEQLMDMVGFNPSVDRMFVVGDLVDRGPRSGEATDWLKQEWFHSIRGNHEQMAIDVYDKMYDLSGWQDSQETILLHTLNGGDWFHRLDGDRQAKVVAAFKELPIAVEIDTDKGKVGLVHAEVPDDDWNSFVTTLLNSPTNMEHIEHYALWGRDIIRDRVGTYFKGVDNIDLVIVGHSVVDTPLPKHNVLYLDTGAYQGKRLSMVCIQGGDGLYQVDSDYKWSRAN